MGSEHFADEVTDVSTDIQSCLRRHNFFAVIDIVKSSKKLCCVILLIQKAAK